MQLISVDLGSYSVKFLKFQQEKNKVVYSASREVVIETPEPVKTKEGEEAQQETVVEGRAQLEAVRELLNEIDGEYRLILNAPTEIVTTRFLELPVGNRKKAQLMVPFQLEEDIPFSLGQSHIVSSIETGKETSKALVNISPIDDFQPFFESLESNAINPRVVTSQESAYRNFIKLNEEVLPQSFCILDIGHTTTKAYFFFDNELTAIHKSYVAGKALSEVISETYNIDFDEATLYKHQNAFFLTSDQYEQVNDNQKTFGTMMEKTFAPLTHEFKRWEIGSRVHQGVGVSEVFLTGGSSNIKNIHNFLAEKFQTKTTYLDTFSNNVDASALDNDEKFRRKFSFANVQAQAYKHKSNIINFLTGDFTLQGQSDLPLRSYTFIATRAALVTLLLAFSFLIERVALNRDANSLTKSLTSIANNPMLEMTARQKRLIRSGQTNTVLKEIQRKNKDIEQEVSLLQASANINALSSLKKIANIVTGMNVEVVQFNSISKGDYNAVFKVNSVQELNDLDRALTGSGLKKVFTDRNESKLTLSLSATEE